MTSPSRPNTLIGLLNDIPADRTAIIVPEQNLRISYDNLRKQVDSVARALAAAGVRRGDRVASALPNGLPTIVAFLAAGVAGTAAPLNPAYKEEEFRFYLEDTNAKVLLLPRDGAEEARKAAGDKVPILVIEMDAAGTVSIAGVTPASHVDPPGLDDVALILHTSGSTGRPKRVPLSHANLSISAQNVARSYALTEDDVSLCVMPLFHVHGLVASTLATLSTGGTVVVPAQVQPALLLARRPRSQRHVVLRRPDAAPAAARARDTRRAEARRRREAALHPVVQRVAAAAGHARSRAGVRRARARGVRHDRSRAPDVVQPAATGQAAARIGRTRHRRAGQHHGRQGRAPDAWRARRGRDQGPQRHDGVREQPRRQRLVLHRRLVPHRRSGRPRRARVPDARRPSQGAHQPRRREDLAARDRRSAARASGGRRSRVLRRFAPDVGRRSVGRGRA